MIVKLLGGIDLAAAVAFLMLIFEMDIFLPFLLFCSGLLLVKGLFALTGDILSFVDLLSSIVLLISIVISLPSMILWIPAFLLLAKGIVSFV